jgi:tetratricopeptide (TPR) repeat protein
MNEARSRRAFGAPPDPSQAGALDELTEALRLLKVWAGDPSYENIKNRINAAWTAAGRPAGELARKATVADCFKPGRRRLNADLVIAVVRALHPDVGYETQWRQALRFVGGEATAAAQVRVQNRLAEDPAGFTGRAAELAELRRRLAIGRPAAGTVVITGMAGVGKTQLAIHAGHLLDRERPFDRVLFVNLRGFHPDPARPPAEPGAVLDGFLRLLGVAGHRIPHDLSARTAAYRDRLTGTRALVVLDDAADEAQIRPLLAERPGCLTLVTSRRRLTNLDPALRLVVDVFTPDEAQRYLTAAAPGVPVGVDPAAPARIARRCGHLPLALGLVTGQLRGRPGWTLTDHADRLDERHRDRHLDAGVELALDVSYQHLLTEQQRLLRLLSLQPGPDLDAFAAAALAATDLSTAEAHLDHLYRDHLLQRGSPGRYTCHDLVRGYAADRAGDEDRPADRRAALTRLFDYYVGAAATAMDALHPAEAGRRPRVPRPGTPTPGLSDLDTARTWLETERPTLVAVAAHAATQGWPGHAIRLSGTLFRYLDNGHPADAVAVHWHALHSAEHTGDGTAQAHALTYLGSVDLRRGRYGPAAEHLGRALLLFRRAGDRAGQARSLSGLGVADERLGRYRLAIAHLERALALFRQTDDRTGEARALDNLAIVEGRLGRHHAATEHYREALALFRRAGDHGGEARTLNNLGYEEARLGRHGVAADHLRRALTMHRRLGNRSSQAWTLHSLGMLHTGLGQPALAAEQHRRALAIFRETADRDGEAHALNGLGEVANAIGDPADALTHHTTAATIVLDTGHREQQARAHAGQGYAHEALSQPARARRHLRRALVLYRVLGMPDADRIRARLAALDADRCAARP